MSRFSITLSALVLATAAGAVGCSNPADSAPAADVRAASDTASTAADAQAPTGGIEPAPMPAYPASAPTAAPGGAPVSAPASAPTGTAPATPITWPAAEEAPRQLAFQPYTISPESKIGFVGSKVTRSHDGGFNQFEGSIVLLGGKIQGASVSVTIDMASLWADNPKLTAHLKSPDFFDVAQYPVTRFMSTGIVENPAGDGYVLSGNLTLHGVTKNVSFPAAIAVTPERATAQAEFSLNRMDFGIVYPGMADDLIREDVLITLDIVATRLEAQAPIMPLPEPPTG